MIKINDMEEWQSGLMQEFTKLSKCKNFRRFESYFFRNSYENKR